MVMDALRGYVQLANGLTEVTRQRAQQAAKALIQQTGAESLTTELTTKVGDLTDEIVKTSKSNRALLQAIVANEVEGAVARLGFVRAEEVALLQRRIDKLEAASTSGPAAAPSAAAAPAKKAAAKKVAAKKAAASGGTAKKAAKKAVKKSPAKKAATRR